MDKNKFKKLESGLLNVVRGQETTIKMMLASILAGGHVLLEDVPGTGKTTLAKTLSYLIDAEFSRVQFTPDLMPSDITGITIYNQKEHNFEFHKGSIFANIVLADEINRASPRTQSALLEAMEENQVTIDGKKIKLPDPFFVCATENPIEMHGTYPLPEAQLDRFICKLSLGYVPIEDEIKILLSKSNNNLNYFDPQKLLTTNELIYWKNIVNKVLISEPLAKYIVQVVRATRSHEGCKLGVSTRGGICLMKMSQAIAFLNDRDYATASDVQTVAPYVLSHRCVLRDGYRNTGKNSTNIIEEILNNVHAPS